jgi:hypothetical protein
MCNRVALALDSDSSNAIHSDHVGGGPASAAITSGIFSFISFKLI